LEEVSSIEWAERRAVSAVEITATNGANLHQGGSAETLVQQGFSGNGFENKEVYSFFPSHLLIALPTVSVRGSVPLMEKRKKPQLWER